ncbi:MAG TPA: DUF4179 domain-containing protein [Ktedonobacterales bacterium]
MQTEDSPHDWELAEEPTLRATFARHAPTMVDTESAWFNVRTQLPLGAQATDKAAAAAPRSTRQAARHPRLRAALMNAGFAAALVVLVGAGVGTAYWGGLFGGPKAQLIGNANLYTTIGQSRTIDGVTISVDQAYADSGNTYIAITARVSDTLAQRYGYVILNHVVVSEASGSESDGLSVSCEPLGRAALLDSATIEHCMLDSGALHPSAGLSRVSVTVEVGEVWLLAKGSVQRTIRPGPWTFQFMLPWRQHM